MGYQVASVLLAPVFALQGRRVRRVTPRLPEPPGARAGTRGVGPPLQLLLVGDSAAAGVGAPSQDEALSGRLVTELARTFKVSWVLVARTGATTAGTGHHLAQRSMRELAAGFDASDTADIAVLCVGGNDVMGRRPLARWLDDVEALADVLRTRFAVRHLLFTGLPPLHAFPALPQPLRWYLGRRARRFDQALARWTAGQPDCEHVPIPLAMEEVGLLATDGLHPGPVLYERWSTELVRRIGARWATRARG